jgi:hypothetical protein
MACNECKDPCDPCTEEGTACDCVQKDMSTDCIVYTGDALACSGIQPNTILTKVIQDLDAHICNKFDQIASLLSIINVGEGSEIFSGNNNLGQRQLRSIVSDNTALLDVIENTDTISIKAGTHRLELLNSDLTLIVQTNQGDTILSTLDIGTLAEYLVDVNYNHNLDDNGLYTLDFEMLGGTTFDTDLSLLNNHLTSILYNSGTNSFDFTLTNGTVVSADMSVPVTDNQLKSDVLITDTNSPSFIENKNASKTETLGAGATYSLILSDNNKIIEIDNGINNVTIDLSGVVITSDFFVGFIQNGTGDVNFVGYDKKPLDLTDIIYGEGHVASITIINGTKYLNGTLRAS